MNKINSPLLVGLLIGFILLVCTTVVTSRNEPKIVPIPFKCTNVGVGTHSLRVVNEWCRIYQRQVVDWEYSLELNKCVPRFPVSKDECLQRALRTFYRPTYSFRSQRSCELRCLLPEDFEYNQARIRYNFNVLENVAEDSVVPFGFFMK